MRLTSPSIHLPTASQMSPRVTFRHYVATEATWDGGNVKISINGGPFVLVPASAFVFNAYNGTLDHGGGREHEPARRPAGVHRHGRRRGLQQLGLSQINLAAMLVAPGDTIQLRFDFGMDGCAGIDGWYVDDFKVQACNTKKALAAKP